MTASMCYRSASAFSRSRLAHYGLAARELLSQVNRNERVAAEVRAPAVEGIEPPKSQFGT